MIPHNINVTRFRYLLTSSSGRVNLLAFFKENKRALLAAGDGMDNIPADAETARKAIEAFSNKGHAIFAKWIHAIEQPVPHLSIEQIIARFRSVEICGLELSREESRELAFSGIRELYNDPPDATWVDYLRTAIVPIDKLPSSIAAVEWLSLAQWWLDRGPKPVSSHSLIAAVTNLSDAIRMRDSKRLKDVEALSEAVDDIARLIDESVVPKGDFAPRRGVSARGPIERAFGRDIDYTHLPVIATNHTSSHHEPFFVSAEAFIDDEGEVFTLSREDLRRAVPDSSQIILYGDKGFASAPLIGEALVYRVERFKTDKPVKVKAIDLLDDRLFRVVSIGVQSDEAHRIRDAITTYATDALARSAVFVTIDGVCLRPRAQSIKRVLGADFDWQLERWDSLEGIELSNGTYICGPLPATTSGLDCAPLSVAARRLIKIFADRSDVKMHKAQRDQLQTLLSSEELSFDAFTRQRLLANLDAIDRSSDNYSEFIATLMQAPAIRADIESRIANQVEVLANQRAKDRNAVQELRREKESLERKRDQLAKDSEKTVKGVREAIQKAFAKASVSGLEVLGQVAVLEALLNRDPGVCTDSNAMPSHSSKPSLIWAQSISPSTEELRDLFARFGVNDEAANRVALAVRLAIDVGLPVVFSGPGHTLLAERVAASVCKVKTAVCDVPLGLLRIVDFGSVIASVDVDGLLLRDANLSDISVYGRELLALIARRLLTNGPVELPRCIFIAGVSGPAALPWPEEIVQFAIKVDLRKVESLVSSNREPPVEAADDPLRRAIRRKSEFLIDLSESRADALRYMMTLL